jgi:hypothetical protein
VRNYYLQQIKFVINDFIGKNKGGAMIRVSMDQGKDKENDLLAIKSFMADVMKGIEKLSSKRL